MKINLKKIGQIISDNRGILLYAIGTLATTIVGAKYGIGLSSTSPSTEIPFFGNSYSPMAFNSKQAAISSLEKNAINSYSSGTEQDAIRKIFDIAKGAEDDYSKLFAIQSIQRISDKSYSSATERLASDAISKLGV